MSELPAKNRVGVLGGGGFTGRELIRFLLIHPKVDLTYISSQKFAERPLGQIYPELNSQNTSLKFVQFPISVSDFPELDVIFICAPDHVALEWAEKLLENNIKVIDIGGSFRLPDAKTFEESYKIKHTSQGLISKAAYGLTEVYKDKISSSELIANPGCYPTSVLLPLWILKEYSPAFGEHIIIDSKSGTSGAGARREEESLAFSHVHENFRPYKVESHQHSSEIETYFNAWSDTATKIRFTPYLLPVFRGLLSSVYIPLRKPLDMDTLQNTVNIFLSHHQNTGKKFLRYFPKPDTICLKNVQNTNFLDFSFHIDHRNQMLIIFSALDNLIKGAAGQAIQNMNLLLGLEDDTSLLQ